MVVRPPKLILASASPRRRELLNLLGIPFEVVVSKYVEPAVPAYVVELSPYVMELAMEKAKEVAARSSDCLVLGADTVVALELKEAGKALGKPVDAADARRMLLLLSGRWHAVHTGMALIHLAEDGRFLDATQTSVCTRVKFRELTDIMIDDYVATGEPLDKAGAYGAQGYAAPFIERFDGDYYNVVGLPLCELGRMLEQYNREWWCFRQCLKSVHSL